MSSKIISLQNGRDESHGRLDHRPQRILGSVET